MKTIVFFDFDGMLYKKDSLLEFTKFSRGNISFYTGLLLLLPYLIGLKLRIYPNEKTKIKFIRHFFKDYKYDDFNTLCRNFSLTKIEQNLAKETYTKFLNHLENNHLVYIVTASLPEWIEPWSNQFGVSVIGTKIEVQNNLLTGNFSTKNCFGIEKVSRIKELINLDEFDEIHVYGNGKGDIEMLTISKRFI
ncbi:HAD family hydrolase [Flavobacterium pectinovorum]|uniref:Haloacid dehalogenase-like hydrolase n=1 Tax=Flavobacterium pectinovorum TaxID=29533 RepID=A0A502EV92_9FLAO|nr:HAD family hydrolase [Flavobacterium pectinovorum]TPG41653.1 haloacid dehalogenase-like hydrolase [Flavobacterium pectinovorum]